MIRMKMAHANPKPTPVSKSNRTTAITVIINGINCSQPSLNTAIMILEGSQQFIQFIITVIAVVRFDLLTGVGLGLACAIFILIIQRLTLADLERRHLLLH